MGTIVCFHAHPDDESIATGGTMAKAKAEGHRVVLVLATRGEHGEVPEGFLEPGEQLGIRRIAETFASAAVLGVDRVEFLGYVDSGMMGEPTNDHPYAFWQADVEHAAARLVLVLKEEGADVLTIYDDHGGYGHPDHIQVHRVGRRAAELAGTPRVFESTMNRDAIRQMIDERRGDFSDVDDDEAPDLGDDFGTPEDEITHAIDVTAHVAQKRASMRCHASQINEEMFFLKMPDEVFRAAFGTEWYVELGRTRAPGAAMEPAILA